MKEVYLHYVVMKVLQTILASSYRKVGMARNNDVFSPLAAGKFCISCGRYSEYDYEGTVCKLCERFQSMKRKQKQATVCFIE